MDRYAEGYAEGMAAGRAENRKGMEEARRLAYEIEGGNRWPVEWDNDTHIMPALKAFKDACPMPEWGRNGSGWKRAALALPAKPAPDDGGGKI